MLPSTKGLESIRTSNFDFVAVGRGVRAAASTQQHLCGEVVNEELSPSPRPSQRWLCPAQVNLCSKAPALPHSEPSEPFVD